jgi:sterol desaturase/sphingolipid hydroxylase (fatty acid hydroxylase superfamily)
VNVDVPASPFDRVVVTPLYHRKHHERGNTHYAFVLPAFDRMFGSQQNNSRPIANDVALATNAMPTSSGRSRR